MTRYSAPPPAPRKLARGSRNDWLYAKQSTLYETYHQVRDVVEVLVTRITEVDIDTLGQVGVTGVVTLGADQLGLLKVPKLGHSFGSFCIRDSRVVEEVLVVVLVLSSEGDQELLVGSVEQRPRAVSVVHHLKILDPTREGDQLPTKF